MRISSWIFQRKSNLEILNAGFIDANCVSWIPEERQFSQLLLGFLERESHHFYSSSILWRTYDLQFLSEYLVHGEKLSKENGGTFVLAHARLDRCTGDHEILRDFGKRKFSVRRWYARLKLCERRKLSLVRGCSHLFTASVKCESC